MKNQSECKCGKGAGCCKNKIERRKKGEHLFSNPTGGIPRCVTCGCDEDDAFVGGEECSYGQTEKELDVIREDNRIVQVVQKA